MTVTVPDYVRAENMVSVFFVPSIASQTAPTVSEMTAGVDITKYSPVDWDGLTADQSKGSQTRMALSESFEVLGRIARSITDFTFTYLPQALGTDPANKVMTMMAPGTSGFIVVRYGISTAVAPATGQKVQSLKVVTGVQNTPATGSDEFAPLVVTQSVSAQGTPVTGTLA